MAKLTLNSLENLQSETTAVQLINDNFQRIVTAVELFLSRNGEAPNQMTAPLDMNSQRIINLPEPAGPNDPARLIDLDDLRGPPGEQGPPGEPGPTGSGSGDMLRSNNLSDVLSATTARTNLGAQAASAILSSLAGLSAATNKLAYFTSPTSFTLTDLTAFGRTLIAAADAAAGRSALGLTAMATAVFGSASGEVAQGNDSRFTQLSSVTKDSTANILATDLAKFVRHTSASAHTWTIPASLGTAGSILSLRNAVGAGIVTLSPGAGVTLYKAGGTSSGSVNLAPGALASVVQEATDVWVVSGAGVT